MTKMLARLGAVALIGLSALGAFAALAAADSLTLTLRQGAIVDVDYRDGHRRYGDERDWDRDRRHRPQWEYTRRGRCEPWFAANKAADFGLRRARVVDISSRRVVVEGRRHGDYRTIVFANIRGCPIIGR